MSDDFGFELDDEETQESTRSAPRGVGVVDGGRSGGGGGSSPDVGRRRRWVIGAIVGVVVLILAVVLATGGSSGKGGAFRSYFGRLAPIATGSQQVGASLNQILAKVRQAQVSDPSSKLEHLVKQAQTQLAAVQALKPPAGLQPEHAEVLSALAFRVTGLQGLQSSAWTSECFRGERPDHEFGRTDRQARDQRRDLARPVPPTRGRGSPTATTSCIVGATVGLRGEYESRLASGDRLSCPASRSRSRARTQVGLDRRGRHRLAEAAEPLAQSQAPDRGHGRRGVRAWNPSRHRKPPTRRSTHPRRRRRPRHPKSARKGARVPRLTKLPFRRYRASVLIVLQA